MNQGRMILTKSVVEHAVLLRGWRLFVLSVQSGIVYAAPQDTAEIINRA